MQLANPIYLWALLALVVPLAIHLLSRKEGRVMPMGSLRHLQETSSQQFRGIKLNELLLLALRMLLIVLFVLMLTGLFWKNQNKEKWVVVDSMLASDKQAVAWADSLVSRGYEWHWLGTNFPLKDQAQPLDVNNWQVITSLGGLHLENAVVFSASRLVDFKGRAVPLPEHVDWQTIDLPDTTFLAYQVKVKDNVVARKVITSSAQTSVLIDTLATTQSNLPVMDSIGVAVVADKNFAEEERLLHAAIRAAQRLPVQIILTDQSRADWVIWLSNAEPPAVPTKILFSKPTSSNKLIEQVTPTQWQLNKLSKENILQQNFTVQLAELLTDNKSINEKISAFDRRAFQVPQLKQATARAALPTDDSVNGSILLLFLVIWAAERTVSILRKQ